MPRRKRPGSIRCTVEINHHVKNIDDKFDLLVFTIKVGEASGWGTNREWVIPMYKGEAERATHAKREYIEKNLPAALASLGQSLCWESHMLDMGADKLQEFCNTSEDFKALVKSLGTIYTRGEPLNSEFQYKIGSYAMNSAMRMLETVGSHIIVKSGQIGSLFWDTVDEVAFNRGSRPMRNCVDGRARALRLFAVRSAAT